MCRLKKYNVGLKDLLKQPQPPDFKQNIWGFIIYIQEVASGIDKWGII